MATEPSFLALVEAADGGSKPAADVLFSVLYAELRRVARRELARQGASPTLSATTLVHQAYVEMAAREGARFPDRGRFLAYAARVMRGLIIDHARRRQAQKRGGQFELTAVGAEIADPLDERELARVSEALDELAKIEPGLAEIVDLKFFCGFSFPEIAAIRGVCERTAQRGWERARIYLHRSLGADPGAA